MATIATLRLRLVAKTKDFSTGLRRVERQVDRMGQRFQNLGRRLTMGVSVPLGLAGLAAGKMATDFEASMSQITGLVGVAAEEVEKMKGSVLDLAGETAKSPEELAKGLFFVTSAGFRGAEALNVLTQAARASAAGLGATEQVADAVTSALNAYGLENLNAADATGILVATVKEGKASAESLAPVLGSILPISSQLGVGFDQVGASLAAMTRLGLNAAESSTALRATLVSLQKPSAGAETQLRKLGTSGAELRKKLKEEGLLATLEDLRVRFKGNEEAMAKVFPNVRALTGVLSLMGKNADQTRAIFASLATAGVAELDAAFQAASMTAKFQLNQAMAQMQVILVRLGDEILPLVIPMIQKFVVVAKNLAQKFSELSPTVRKAIVVIAGIAVVAGPILLAAGIIISAGSAVVGFFATVSAALVPFIAAISAGGIAAAAPFVILAAAIATLVVVIASDWERLKESVLIIWNELRSQVIAGSNALAEGMVAVFNGIAQAFASWGQDLMSVGNWVGEQWTGFITRLGQSGNFLVRAFVQTGQNLATIWNFIIETLRESFIGRGIAIIQQFVSTIGETMANLLGIVVPKIEAVGGAVTGFASKLVDDTKLIFGTLKSEVAEIFEGTVGMTKAMTASLDTTLKKTQETNAATNASIKKTTGMFATFQKVVSENTAKMGERMVKLGDQTAAGIGKMTAELVKGKMEFDDFVRHVVKALAKLAIQAAFAGSGPIGAFIGSFASEAVVGSFAGGGVIPMGKFGIVGEEGPELAFAGAAPLSIEPIGGTVGGGVNLTQTNILQGFDLGDRRTARKFIRTFAEEAKNETVEAVQLGSRLRDLAQKNVRRAS